jgi:hypothetical protein
MKYFALITELLPVIEAIFNAVEETIAAGKDPVVLRDTIMDHMTQMPGKIRAA